MHVRILAALSCLLFSLPTYSHEHGTSEKIHVLTSITPLKLIIEELDGDAFHVETLLKGTDSPHHFSLKASQIRAINQADLTVWVGPTLEYSLHKAVRSARQLITLVEKRDNDTHHDEQHSHSVHKENHVWLTPDSAVSIAEKVVTHLKEINAMPENMLKEKLENFRVKMKQLDSDIGERLSPYTNTPFSVFHDGYSQFVKAYNLQQVAALTQVPEQQIGAKKLSELAKVTKTANCMLAETSEINLANRYAKALNLKVVEVDLLAQKDEYASYSEYLIGMTAAFERCLSRE